jgi:hypothetical protein
MPACDNIDLSKDQSIAIMQTIQTMITGEYSPSSIVDYVCAECNTPEEGDTNYCLVTCVSACVYKYAVFTPPSTYSYNTPAITYACISACFPVFKTSSCSGGGNSSVGRGCSDNVKNNKATQKKNMDGLLNKCNVSLLDQLSRSFTGLAITTASFALGLCMLAEHLSEITLANITKKIGASIDWIAKIWKSIKDMYNSAINWAYTAGESDISGHFKKALQDALTTLQGYLTDIMKNIGQYIEQIGEFLYDLADRMWDLKDIAFNYESLAAQMREKFTTINNIIERQTNAVSNCNECKSALDATYDAQYAYTNAMDKAVRDAADVSESGLNNLNIPQVDISIPNLSVSTTGVSIS